jgi:hypothetical protein
VYAEVEIKANSNSSEVVETMWSTCAKYVGLFGFAMSVYRRVGEREVETIRLLSAAAIPDCGTATEVYSERTLFGGVAGSSY